jgi:hypothetical protein
MRIAAQLTVLASVLFVLLAAPCFASAFDSSSGESDFPPDLQSYNDAGQSIFARLQHRVEVNPFNLVGTLIFLIAIVHTFLVGRFRALSHKLDRAHQKKIEKGTAPLRSISHPARLFHFLGEVEVVFGLWAAVLFLAIVYSFDWSTAVGYVSHKVNYTEAMFVVVIMTLASTRPILKLSEALMDRTARLFGGSLKAWWLSILTLGPLLGSFITEPAAMTISAMLLSRKFYALQPSTRFKYATLGLLFVNTSVGGTLTHFAAPPVLMVAGPWGWGTGFMLAHFGWKAVLGILVSNLLYAWFFDNELNALQKKFAVRAIKDEILTKHLSRDTVDRHIHTISKQLQAESHAIEDAAALVEGFTSEVEKRLEREYMESIAESDVDPELALQAFRERFAELKLYHFQQEMPYILPKEQRAPIPDPNWDQREDPVPWWITIVHVLFMGWTIANAHHPVLFIPGLLFFLGFAAVTADDQNTIDLHAPLLVGFFLAGLVTHGGVQGWWIEPVLSSLSEVPLMLVSTGLTAFNDNAAITYLSTLVPGFTDGLKYAVVAGAVTGGGLTVIANAPNPAGQAILKKHFRIGVAPAGLLAGALIPTVIMFAVFLVFR